MDHNKQVHMLELKKVKDHAKARQVFLDKEHEKTKAAAEAALQAMKDEHAALVVKVRVRVRVWVSGRVALV